MKTTRFIGVADHVEIFSGKVIAVDEREDGVYVSVDITHLHGKNLHKNDMRCTYVVNAPIGTNVEVGDTVISKMRVIREIGASF